MNGYGRFGAMVATSTVVMFGLMYLNTYQRDHLFFSETRAYMALVMGASMAVIMLAYIDGDVQESARESFYHRRELSVRNASPSGVVYCRCEVRLPVDRLATLGCTREAASVRPKL